MLKSKKPSAISGVHATAIRRCFEASRPAAGEHERHGDVARTKISGMRGTKQTEANGIRSCGVHVNLRQDMTPLT